MRHNLFSRAVKGVVLGAAAGAMFLLAGCAGTPMGQEVEATLAGQLAYPHYEGVKKRLAVLELRNKVKTPIPNKAWKIGDGLTEMLTTELFKTNRFIMVERAALAEIVREQELGQTGLVRKETAAKVGQLLGAQLLVTGAVTEFEAVSSGGGGGLSFAGFALSLKTKSAHVAVDIRLVDASTGQILKSTNAEAKAEETALGFAAQVEGVTFGSDAFHKTPLGKATREAIHKAVMFIIREMEQSPWTGRVVKVKDGRIYLNAGINANLKPGFKVAAYAKGEELVDPTTGLNLGSEDTYVGTVTLQDVRDKFSSGTLAGQGSLKRGDLLKVWNPPGIKITRPLPDAAKEVWQRAVGLYNKKDYAGAAAALPEFLKQAPSAGAGHHLLGRSLKMQGKWAEAVPHLRRAVELEPDHPWFRYHLADALAETGKLEQAKAEYEATLRLNPNHKEANRKLTLLATKRESPKQGMDAVGFK